MSNLTAAQARELHQQAVSAQAEHERAFRAAAAANRARYPDLAEIADQVRAAIPGARVTYVGDVRPHTAAVFARSRP